MDINFNSLIKIKINLILIIAFTFAGISYLSNGMVSAQSSGMQTCFVNLNGTACQEYSSGICDSQCTTSCFPGRRSETSECRLGTCYDSSSGLCGPGSPRISCENNGGQWSSESPAQCNRKCCLINPDGSGGASQARLTTARQCSQISETYGMNTLWETSISGQSECLARATTQSEGACVLAPSQGETLNNCEFTTETNCVGNREGTFYAGKLCTNSELNTACDKTSNTQCFDGKDGVYFIDSCRNRANIYDSTKLNSQDYWNVVVPAASSCSLATSSNPVANQARCGNCNYISGSTCGTPIQGKDTNPIYGQNVCRDLGCIKEDGTKVKHRSSWCAFDGAIGVDGADGSNAERSVDVPGSRHYRKLCFDGEVRNETCAEYRNGICAENETDGFTTAVCKTNTASSCLEQNEDPDDLARCEENPDCFLKKVEIDGFRVEVCSPKYPIGRELSDESENTEEYAENVCSYATKDCGMRVSRSRFGGSLRCTGNCECMTPFFVESMNNLCMSLGDCGGNVNLAGEFTKNFVVVGRGDHTLPQSYINDLIRYATPVRGQIVNLKSDGIASISELENFNPEESIFFDPLSLISRSGGRIVSFTCNPWEPPNGGANCGKCTENGLGCTKYKCASLGKACELINENSDNVACISASSSDTAAPQIEFDSSVLSSGYSHEALASVSGVKIKSTSASDGCIKEATPVSFGIKLNEPGKCKVDTERTDNYEDMSEFFDGSSPEDYLVNHNNTFAMPTLDDLGVSGIDPNRRGEFNLYIRCEDASPNSNSNDEEYAVNFCVSPQNDLQPPEIEEFVPASPGVAGINADSLDIEIYTNEPTTCRYSSTDQIYETMENEADCDNDINQVTLRGWWLCNARLNVSSISTTGNYYFRCADQPWLGEEVSSSGTITTEPERNVATESETYEVQKTTTALSIDSVSPNGTTIFVASEPVPVTFTATTSGGIDNGKSICRYSLDNRANSPFFETDSSTHKQTWDTLNAGNHNVDLTCRDRAGNTATGNAQFNIDVDDTGPIITRVYNSGSSLKVITNENSICEYSTSTCSFEFGTGTALTGASKVHTMSYTNRLTYKIKCKDSFGNEGTCMSVTGGY